MNSAPTNHIHFLLISPHYNTEIEARQSQIQLELDAY